MFSLLFGYKSFAISITLNNSNLKLTVDSKSSGFCNMHWEVQRFFDSGEVTGSCYNIVNLILLRSLVKIDTTFP